MEKVFEFIAALFITVVLAFFIALLFGIVVMYLWNWLMPVIFGLPTITWIQAAGLIFFIHLVFPSGSSSSK